MMKFATRLVLASLLACAASAQAGTISDVGNFAYWGGNDHKLGDAIGGSLYDIQSATVTRDGDLLKILINTNFAGHAGSAPYAAPKGIGYGDVLLAAEWKPFGTDPHHLADNARTGTKWSYGLNLDNRWSNTGGTFTLYELNGATNAANLYNSQDFMTCIMGSQCYYRDDQAVAVKTASSSVRNTGLSGKWSVAANRSLQFDINIGTSNLANFDDLALHWGQTCQNDVIEGITDVPEPATPALIGLALLGLALRRAARTSSKG